MTKLKENLTASVLAAQQGDTDAMEQLLESCSQSIYYVVYKMLKSKEGAEDLTQEALVLIWKKLNTLQEPAAFYGWADKIAANLCMDKLRKKGVKIAPEAGEPEVYEALPESNEALLPENALDQEETQRLVSEIVDSLPEAQRMCVLLYYFREMSVADIAQAMECSEGTVKSRLSAARDKIRAGVLHLEKVDGVKLYAVPLLPLLLGESTLMCTPDLLQRLLPAGTAVATGAAGAAAAGAAADGATKTGLSGLWQAAKAKFTAASLGAKIGGGVAAAVVTTGVAVAVIAGGAPYVNIYSAKIQYQGVLRPNGYTYSIALPYLVSDGGRTLEHVDLADYPDATAEIVSTELGATINFHPENVKREPNFWYDLRIPDGSMYDVTIVRTHIDGKDFLQEYHKIPSQELPGVTYDHFPIVLTEGQPFTIEDLGIHLPDGFVFSVTDFPGDKNFRFEPEEQITLTAEMLATTHRLRWNAHNVTTEETISYTAEVPYVVANGQTGEIMEETPSP